MSTKLNPLKAALSLLPGGALVPDAWIDTAWTWVMGLPDAIRQHIAHGLVGQVDQVAADTEAKVQDILARHAAWPAPASSAPGRTSTAAPGGTAPAVGPPPLTSPMEGRAPPSATTPPLGSGGTGPTGGGGAT